MDNDVVKYNNSTREVYLMLTKYVERMFPISFARAGIHGARSLSESNLISWLQHFSPDSATPHTFMITESIPEVFGLPLDPHQETSNLCIEFILGGYYVKLSDRYFTDEITGFVSEGEQTTSYYASIKFRNNGDNECFITLDGGESPQGDDVHFTALSIDKTPPTADYVLHLFDLKQTNTSSGEDLIKKIEYTVPRTSLRTIDGGEI